ncbi:MAG: NADH dehydrogenase [ubiquinone] 1 alpha subcomplex assembly factor 7 [Alphaproteobacteria bacterium]|nr:NADH dehydrogenase [ubiquinone] 1 alpha subcomplex assembly factor 7 [Alphaproteobacteria bacterium]
MSELLSHIQSMIRAQGPITLAAYMGLALGHPKFGYYHSQTVFGAEGDFITAPEISQMFGELIGLWCVQRWRDMGSPREFLLCELGPGRGALMADALRAAKLAPDFLDAARLHLVETSPALREKQRLAIARPIIWHDRLADLPLLPALVIANEFFDALPIHQFERAPDGWRERMVTLDPQTDQLCFALSPVPVADAAIFSAAVRTAPEGAIAEICPAGQAVMTGITGHLAEQGGAALILDYGPMLSAPGGSFQAVRGHEFCDPLQNPGMADLTAHVDFQCLAHAAARAGCQTDGPVTQGQFLLRLGMAERAQRLAQNATPPEREAIESALRRLTDPGQMGSLFKVLALRHPALTPSPGFGA